MGKYYYLNKMEYLGITNSSLGIGDKIIFTSLPENYYKSTGNKIVDLDNCWVYDNNPYIVRNIKYTLGMINLWSLQYEDGQYMSAAERICKKLKIQTFLRHPRLYIYEDEPINLNRIIVHISGKSYGNMSDNVINQIQNNYKDYEIIQIGGIDDKKTNFINKLGLSILDTTKLIASSGVFIGVNSGFMNIAKCYPRIRKKIVLYSDNLQNLQPNSKNWDYWIDYNWEYFNCTDNDIGITNSYLKI